MVAANIELIFLAICLAMHFFLKFLGNLIATYLNDKSQYAKFLLIFSQIIGLVGGLFMMYAATNYYVDHSDGVKIPDVEQAAGEAMEGALNL